MATQAWDLSPATRALVAEVLVALVAANWHDPYKSREVAVAEGCHLLGIDPSDYRAAERRNPEGPLRLVRPPSPSAGTTPVAETRPAPEPARRQMATRSRERNAVGQLLCSACAKWLPEDDFAPRADRPGHRKSSCRPCLAEHQRRHYRSAAELVRSGPDVVEPGSPLLEVSCCLCDRALQVGQQVEAVDVLVAHCTCPAAPIP